MRFIAVKTILVLCIFLFSHCSYAKNLYVSTGAWQGYVNIGLGDQVGSWEYLISYGYTPKYIGGHDISQFHLKGKYNFDFFWDSFLYLGAYVMYNPAARVKFTYDAPYPDKGYYPLTSILGGLSLGVKKEVIPNHSLFLEWSALSPQLERFYNNTSYSNPINDYASMGLGYIYHF